MTLTVGRTAARYLKALAVARGDDIAASGYVERSGWDDKHLILRAVSAGTTSNSDAFLRRIGNDFMAFVRQRSIIGRVAGFRRMPFNTGAIRQTDAPTASWVPEGVQIPVGRGTFARGTPLVPRKVAVVSVQSLDLAREADTEELILRDLALACREALDRAFIDPDNSGAGAKPASVTYGQQQVTPSQPPRLALAEAVEALCDGGGDATAAYWIVHPALHATLMLSQVAAPDGRLAGLPVITSAVVPKDTSGSMVALIDPTGIEMAGGDEAELAISTHGDIALDEDPSGGGAIGRTGLWQSDLFAMRAVASVNWRCASGRAVFITDMEL